MHYKKIAAFAVGPIGGAILGFVTLPLITWFFSTEDVGRLAILNVAISFSTLFFSLGLDQAYVREYHEEVNKAALFKTVFLPGFLLLTMTLFFIITLNGALSNWLLGIQSIQLSILIAFVLVSTFIARFLSLILRMSERGFAYSMSQILPKLLLIIIILGFIVFNSTKDITNLVIAYMVSSIFVFLVYSWNTRKDWLSAFRQQIDYEKLLRLLKFGLPLIFGSIAFWGLTATDKVLLKELSDYNELGVYSVAVSFAAAATVFQSVFSTIWSPMVYKWAAEGNNLKKIDKVNRYVLLIVTTFFCLAGLFSWLVTLFLPAQYESVQWIVISCLGYPLLYTLSETTVVGIGISRRPIFSMVASIIAFIANIIGNYYFIPSLGAVGAAISTCIAFWLFFILRTEFSILLWRAVPRVLLYTYTGLAVGGAVLNTLYGDVLGESFFLYWFILLFSLFIFFKAEVKEIKSIILKKVNHP
ncbi:oligosaccharide flippase family protein [Pseudoalteromonas haloplanktis]|uniref:Oligosaccharide flippase family protein n=1 Tax=Pseudoalteromonas haloplanktis TaxID=228 RepID=A0ABU1BI32_PSEHA|nr:oligosaccharide flippase family protein [Pseudoalteromonas haloplanktis]MDQ9094140.1 oligosaccharide flippase family protein [Pseudoalteromonas haloplanktis]